MGGADSGNLRNELDIISDMFARKKSRDEVEILPARYFEEKIGRERMDFIGDDLEDDDDDDSDEAGYIGIDDIIGAMHAASIGKKLTHKQRKAIRQAARAAKQAAKKDQRASNEGASDLMNAMRAANRPIVRGDAENVMRVLNMPMSSIVVPAGGTNSFAIVVQESMRVERLFLYPVGGNYDNLFVGDMFCGRQTNSIVPGNDEPMIFYSPTAVNSSIEGFTVNYGLTLRLLIRNATAAPVTVGGKIKGRTLTT